MTEGKKWKGLSEKDKVQVIPLSSTEKGLKWFQWLHLPPAMLSHMQGGGANWSISAALGHRDG